MSPERWQNAADSKAVRFSSVFGGRWKQFLANRAQDGLMFSKCVSRTQGPYFSSGYDIFTVKFSLGYSFWELYLLKLRAFMDFINQILIVLDHPSKYEYFLVSQWEPSLRIVFCDKCCLVGKRFFSFRLHPLLCQFPSGQKPNAKKRRQGSFK